MKIAVAGMGYVGLSIAVLLAQNNEVTVVDVVHEKVEMLNLCKSPIQDDYIEKYLLDDKNGEHKLSLIATTDAKSAYKDAEYIVIAVPTNYDTKKNYFDTSAIENVLDTVVEVNSSAIVVIKSTVPVGYTEYIRAKYKNIIFCPEFLRESKALYDNLYPSRIILGTDCSDETFKKKLRFSQSYFVKAL